MSHKPPIVRIVSLQATPVTGATIIKALAVAFSAGIVMGYLVTNTHFLGHPTGIPEKVS